MRFAWITPLIVLIGRLTSADPVLFEDVSVIPLASAGAEVLAHQDVLVEGDHIAAIASQGTITPPVGTRRVDGRGRFLMPGLYDMHAHVRSEEELVLHLAHGVTTVRNMAGSPWHLGLARRLDRGDLPGPRLITTSPILNAVAVGSSTTSVVVHQPDQVPAIVADLFQQGYPAIKVYTHLSAAVHQRILTEAAIVGLPVVGHVPTAVGLEAILTGSQRSIEHLMGYATILPPSSEALRLESLTVSSGIWNCPTLTVVDRQSRIQVYQAAPPSALRWVPPNLVAAWMAETGRADDLPGTQAVVARLAAQGAPLMLGTDVGGAPFAIAGDALLGELTLTCDAGLSADAVLRLATQAPATFLGLAGRAGVVAVHAQADLLLLDADPLADLTNCRRITAVMVRGVLYDRTTLDALLDGVALQYGVRTITIRVDGAVGAQSVCGEALTVTPAEDGTAFGGLHPYLPHTISFAMPPGGNS